MTSGSIAVHVRVKPPITHWKVAVFPVILRKEAMLKRRARKNKSEV